MIIKLEYNLTGLKEEADRLEAQHQVFNLVFDNRLIFPPVEDLDSVLDLGYGAASWAIEVAEMYPDCEVRPLLCHFDDELSTRLPRSSASIFLHN